MTSEATQPDTIGARDHLSLLSQETALERDALSSNEVKTHAGPYVGPPPKS